MANIDARVEGDGEKDAGSKIHSSSSTRSSANGDIQKEGQTIQEVPYNDKNTEVIDVTKDAHTAADDCVLMGALEEAMLTAALAESSDTNADTGDGIDAGGSGGGGDSGDFADVGSNSNSSSSNNNNNTNSTGAVVRHKKGKGKAAAKQAKRARKEAKRNEKRHVR